MQLFKTYLKLQTGTRIFFKLWNNLHFYNWAIQIYCSNFTVQAINPGKVIIVHMLSYQMLKKHNILIAAISVCREMFSVIQLKLIHVKHSSIETVLSNHKIMHMSVLMVSFLNLLASHIQLKNTLLRT